MYTDIYLFIYSFIHLFIYLFVYIYIIYIYIHIIHIYTKSIKIPIIYVGGRGPWDPDGPPTTPAPFASAAPPGPPCGAWGPATAWRMEADPAGGWSMLIPWKMAIEIVDLYSGFTQLQHGGSFHSYVELPEGI